MYLDKVGDCMNKLKINLMYYIFFLYCIFIIINDYLCFIFKTNISWILYIISFALVALLGYLFRKKVELKKIEFNKLDVVFYIVILLVFLSRLTLPDTSFDTLNYHLYTQSRLFSNNTTFNFFPARWINTFSLPLADRMHFFARSILGYRLGNIINLFCMLVIYNQIKMILKKYIANKNYISIISGFIIITEQLLFNMITYYVDLLSIPIFLEIFYIIISNKKVSNLINYYVLFSAGIVVSMKISNAFLLIPFALTYIYKFRKNINYKTFIAAVPLIGFPLAVYLLNNYLQTGNPFFPFYNSIFKSSYLSYDNWMETFYGPKRIRERLLWPIYLFLYPRRAFDANFYYGRIGFGYISSIILVIYYLYNHFVKKEKIDSFFYINALYIALCLMWANFMMGYIRYALVLEIFSGLVMAISIYKFIKSKNILLFSVSIMCILGFGHTTILSLHDILYSSQELSWRPSYYSNSERYKTNLSHIFDKNFDYTIYLKDVDCIGIVDYNSGYATMISKNKRIINLNEGYNNEYGKKESDNIINSCSNIYTISTSTTLDRTNEYLTKAGYSKKGEYINFKTDFLDYNSDLIIFEIHNENT